MSGPWDQYVEQAAEVIDPDPFDQADPHYGSHAYEFRRDLANGKAARLLAAVGPLIAEDTRERMVAAAGRAVERETAPPPFYYCPTSGEIEQTYEGGFTICCEAPLGHEPISPAAVAAAQRVPS